MSLARIKIKRDTAADYTASNIVLLLGEFAYETDTFTLSGGVRHYKFKIGDGTTAWNDLPYARLSAVGGGGGASAFIDLTDVPGAYAGAASRYVKVNETADGLEFEAIEAADLPTGIDAVKIGDGSVSNAEFQTLNGAQQPYTTAEQTKLSNITVTQAVNLDTMESDIAGKQPLDTDLTAIAALVSAADKIPYATGAGTWSLADFTSLARTQLALAAPSAVRFYKINADNTITLRTSAEMLSDIGAQASGSYLVTTNNLSDLANAGTARTNLGATTVGAAMFTLTNPSAVTFLRVNTDNTVTALSAADFRTALSVPSTSEVVSSLEATTGALTLGALIAAATAKTTPVDADSTVICDSENANATKELTFTNLKAFLKTYNDTLYQATDADLTDLASKWAAASASAQASLQFHEDTDNGAHKITVQAPAALAADWTLTLPDTNGDADQVLKTDGNGVTSWTTPSAGALTYWDEARNTSAPNATVPAVSMLPDSGDTNADGVHGANGTGSLLAQVPDSGTGGGNKRGTYSVDWQRVRSNANHVCLGNYQVIAGGQNNQLNSGATNSVISGGTTNVSIEQGTFIGGGASNSITGSYGVVGGGSSNSVAASSGVIGGGNNNTVNAQGGILEGDNCQVNALQGGVLSGAYANAYLYGMQAWANGRFSAIGDAQSAHLVARKSITGTAIAEMGLDGSTTRLVLSSTNCIWNFQVQVVAVTSSVGNGTGTAGASFAATYGGCIKRLNTTTSLVGTIQTMMAVQADTNINDAVVTITADDTNEALKIEFTPPTTAGSTTVTLVVATIELTQVKY
jgi:hypothetical protein